MDKYLEISKEEAEKLIQFSFDTGWRFFSVRRGGNLAGIILIKENEIHCWRDNAFKGRWLTRQTLEEVLGSIIKDFGSVVTSVMKSNRVGHRFVQRLGFKPKREDDRVIYYEMEYLNHARL